MRNRITDNPYDPRRARLDETMAELHLEGNVWSYDDGELGPDHVAVMWGFANGRVHIDGAVDEQTEHEVVLTTDELTWIEDEILDWLEERYG